MVPNARFTELLADIEPSPTTKTHASSGHTNVRSHLQNHEDFKDRYRRSFLSGSYARDTSIRPRSSNGTTERPDVDIIVVTNFTQWDTPEEVLLEVKAALEDAFDVKRLNKRSVRIEPWQAEMDIVPVIQAPGGFYIADRESGTWQFTNPPHHTSWSSAQNSAFNGQFKKLVKLLKWWRRQNPSGKRPKGFVLEVLVANHAPKGETHLGEAYAQLLENIYQAYATRAALDIKPFIPDPAVPTNDILAKVTLSQWKNFLEKVRVHAGYARRAQDEDDMDEATRLWRKVFGERFKASAAVAKASSNSAVAIGTSAGDYTFPDANASPNKPRGFA